MSTTISDGTTTLALKQLDGYSAKRESANVVHAIVGTVDNAITLRGSGLRTGSLTGVIGTSDSLMQQFDTLLRKAAVLTLADTDRPWIGMRFVVTAGGHSIDLDDETRNVWTVTFEFEETTS